MCVHKRKSSVQQSVPGGKTAGTTVLENHTQQNLPFKQPSFICRRSNSLAMTERLLFQCFSEVTQLFESVGNFPSILLYSDVLWLHNIFVLFSRIVYKYRSSSNLLIQLSRYMHFQKQHIWKIGFKSYNIYFWVREGKVHTCGVRNLSIRLAIKNFSNMELTDGLSLGFLLNSWEIRLRSSWE